MDFTHYPITGDDAGRRTDRIVRRFLPDMPLSGIYSLIRKGLVRVNGKKVQPGTAAPESGELWIASILLTGTETQKQNTDTDISPVKPRDVVDVLLETRDLLFICKPSGIPVHGEGGLDRLVPSSESAERSLSFRTGPLHRLDRDTSGLIAFSRSLAGAHWFSEAICAHRIEKYYLGIAEGLLTEQEEWHDQAEDGKEMITQAAPLASNSAQTLTLVRYRIITGRKHQIRIQTTLHGHHLLCDERYGRNQIVYAPGGSYFLHAWHMVFPSDRPDGLPDQLTVPLPERFSSAVAHIFGKDVLARIGNAELYWSHE